jgi:nicotinate-nucleotide pyrophosphorylase (carboxylating)
VSIDLTELGWIDEIVERALREDLAAGDVTTRATVPPEREAAAMVIARQTLVVAAIDVVRGVFARIDPRVSVQLSAADGAVVAAGTELARLSGPARAILAGERTALNLLARACGVATLTAAFVAAAGDTLRIADTRKTMPGLRALDRYAVRCGGGHNHRHDLGSGVLIKENHIRASGGVRAAVRSARRLAPHPLRIACECTNVDEVEEALGAGADVVLLDNMDDQAIVDAVKVAKNRVLIEVSGNVTLERVARLVHLGVDVVSVGALTHSAPAADLSLLFEL